jgi:UDP-glucose 4-epimerase
MALKLRIAITGSGGYLAHQLIERLGSEPDCEFILGLDIRPRAPKVACAAEFIRFDLTAPWEELAEQFRSKAINSGMHLAWQFNPIHNIQRHREVDVEGSRNFFRAAEAAGLKRIVYAGSTTAYVNPANPAEPPFIREDTPVSGSPRYLYSKHKAEVDRMAQEFMARHPEVQFTLFRGAIVLGPHTQNIVSKMMEWPWRSFPWLACVRGANPPMQFLSEEDIAALLFDAIKTGKTGIFNLAGDGAVRFNDLVRQVGKKPLHLPAFLIYPATAALWALRLTPFPAGILDLIRFPWVGDNQRLKTSFGYTPRHTSQQALDSFIQARVGGNH